MNLKDHIGTLTSDFSSMAANLKEHQDKLLLYGRELETIIADRTAQLAHEKDHLEASVAERTAQLNAANDVLTRQATRLSRRNQEITLFSKMNDFLQASTTEAQAYTVISETVTQLFPDDSGAIFVLSASRDILEAAASWGSMPPARRTFNPDECWAHRRGQVHLAQGHELRCAHVPDNRHMYFCLPLLAQGETLGILHILGGLVTNDPTDAERMAERCGLAKILGDNIGLGIANLKLREAMRSLSIRDPLTGLFNRRYMEEALALELHRTRRNAAQLAIIMLDIDHFKKFNDDFGHDAGDAVLRELGGFLRKHVRGSDVPCRYGGEEFILILSPSTIEGAMHRADTIRDAAQHLCVRHGGRELGKITLSLGVAIFPDDASDVEATVMWRFTRRNMTAEIAWSWRVQNPPRPPHKPAKQRFSTWIMYEGQTAPLLRSLMTPLTVTASNATRTYDGSAHSGGNGVTYSSTPNGNLLGTLSYSGTSQGALNVNSYTITPGGLHSNQQGYIVSYVDGALDVTPKTLTATVAAPSNVYDGDAAATPTLSITAGLVGTETVTATGTADH